MFYIVYCDWYSVYVSWVSSITFSAFQVACDSMNKGFQSYIQRHRALRLAAIMVAPWFLPADIIYNYTLRYILYFFLNKKKELNIFYMQHRYKFLSAKRNIANVGWKWNNFANLSKEHVQYVSAACVCACHFYFMRFYLHSLLLSDLSGRHNIYERSICSRYSYKYFEENPNFVWSQTCKFTIK